ncbi:DMP19 family protein [Calycomorphotria hydatis]|uniref:DNA mimic protein DMP19 C-terminal domain-containing protein n=1 Tax=Calycomorphotria hydatis TaxID=2528027 RepID=A0A517T8B7_9PLAN|nr:hypothetical protein [Calycomorphotria hydatis]QDT64630.1 hypothetical protein V22_18700 [Calycomorphotria hydatis]
MHEIELLIRQMIFRSLPSKDATGLIRAEMIDGCSGFTGSYEYAGSNHDFQSILPKDYSQPRGSFGDLIEELHEASNSESFNSPWYRCNIEIANQSCSFQYWYEDSSISDLSAIERDLSGQLPSFPFRNRFSNELLKQLEESDYEVAFLAFVPNALANGTSLPPKLYSFFGLYDFLSDTFNGGLNQYFAREDDCFGAGIDRSLLYEKVRESLSLLDMPDALVIFDEAISLYSHFHPRVDQARVEMNIPAVPRQEESDIGGRLYDIQFDIESGMWEYFSRNLSEFSVN